MKKELSVLDRVFLAGESRESMMHVGGMFIFDTPDGASPTFLRELMEELREAPVHSPWNLRLRHPEFLTSPLQAWVPDDEFDLDYHVRRSALPTPGDERELGILVSRLHSHQMDFHRPLWEVHIIEGLSGNRFALYAKVHHSLVDGYTAMKLLAQSMSTDPQDMATQLFFSLPPHERPKADPSEPPVPTLNALRELGREQVGVTKNVGQAFMKLMRAVQNKDKDLVAPLQAPKTIFNRRISRNRRFATQQYQMDQMKAVAKAAGGTLNDVALALCGGAAQRLLLELGELPDHPLVAMLPVNIRPKDDPGGGNAVGAILASLATDLGEPKQRLEAVVASTSRAKEQLQGMTKNAIFQYSALLMTPLSVQTVTATAGRVRPAFNVVISNVPGPRKTLYFRGARMRAVYPLSIAFHGYGLNVTINSYEDTLNFGYIGCREAVPHLQRLAVYGADEMRQLSEVYGVA